MKKLLLLSSLAFVLLLSACTKDDADMSTFAKESITIDSIDHFFATEILRLNILAEYGGVFRQMQLYHTEVFEVGMPCDSVFQRVLKEDELPNYSLNIPVDINSTCQDYIMTGNNRWYRGFQQEGTQTAESDLAAIEVNLEDNQVIAGNADDDVYTYGQNGLRSILITKGIAAEIDPTASLFLMFPNCTYDRSSVKMTEVVEATFSLSIKTNEFPAVSNPRKDFDGMIKLVDGRWTVYYEDGVIDYL